MSLKYVRETKTALAKQSKTHSGPGADSPSRTLARGMKKKHVLQYADIGKNIFFSIGKLGNNRIGQAFSLKLHPQSTIHTRSILCTPRLFTFPRVATFTRDCKHKPTLIGKLIVRLPLFTSSSFFLQSVVDGQ